VTPVDPLAPPRRPPRIVSFAVAMLLFALLWLALGGQETLLGWLHLEAESSRGRATLIGLRTALWVVGIYLINRVIKRFVWDGALARAMGRPVPGVLKEMGSVMVFAIGLAAMAAIVYGQSIAGLIAALGAGGVVLGFALRNLLADLFTGLAVNVDQNFAIGDWLSVPNPGGNPNTIGQVEEIGWRCTRLSTEEGTTVIVPNSLLGFEKVVNISRPVVATRYEVSLTIDYSVPADRVRRILAASLHALQDQEGFCAERQPRVLIDSTSPLGIHYHARYWIYPWQPLSPTVATDRVMSRLLEDLRIAGITPAYPKTDVYHASMPVRHVDGHSREDRIALLSRIDIFEPLSKEELERLSDSLNRLELDAGETLFRHGDEGDSLFVVVEGLLDARIDLKGGGTEENVGRIRAGEFFGEMALLTGDPRSATLVAATDAVIYEVGREAMMELVEARPEISNSISQAVAERQLERERALKRQDEDPEPDKVESIARQILNRMTRIFRRNGQASVAETERK